MPIGPATAYLGHKYLRFGPPSPRREKKKGKEGGGFLSRILRGSRKTKVQQVGRYPRIIRHPTLGEGYIHPVSGRFVPLNKRFVRYAVQPEKKPEKKRSLFGNLGKKSTWFGTWAK